ncbi:MAG: WYL domain-containing protein, partial [Actinomyces sp.]|nr:WYL domain-containing protein [Actinomyces sp.]
TKLRASSAENRKSSIDFHLSGAEHVLPLFQAITSASVVSFAYRSPRGTDSRAVEPWNLLISGSAIYLQGYDLDRGDERSFRLSRILPPIEVLGEPGDAYPRPSDRPTIGISRPLEPSFLARVGSEAWNSALRDDKATGADTEQWQRFRGHVAPYSFWTHFILSHAHDVVPIGPTEFASDLQKKLQSALSLNGGQNA